ncbi:hypothetical protein GobsT_06240 [Gemmata obscuriglobus]|uniref:Uncharacterized protein n=1 Tax=Gemmata obscuriglobus TaxID=114 RepID=A0A2Z3HAV5_9BACT|nr:hypothetical protein [Gemmata obscuriglobus]AWM40826.1 hypothetical protein C1280_30110 [Gemmata obscuriglobus]QEG25889.1 hypothetical protein GobsT_06240 [Gemmata obscuriglobus]VTR99945.1 unnamed protein product [Gemmata obscuriglobus UQM 2246]
MLLTRWKLMAGVLGVSIGGLAAAASQCPKLDKTKGRQPEAPVTAEAPKLPPAGAPSAPKVNEALPPELPAPSSPKLPELPPALPAAFPAPVRSLPAGAPPVPAIEKAAKPEEPKAAPALPALPLPDAKPALEPTKTTTPAPAAPPMNPPKPVAEAPKIAPLTVPLPAPEATGGMAPSKPLATPPVMPASGTAQPTGSVLPLGTGAPAQPPALIESPKITPTPIEQEKPTLDVPASKPTPAPAAGAVKVEAMKYRIVLRVGEGEPTFEVKSGDDLVLKVACEKVDIKSPEKGVGLSAVTARGKVRFAGFGVEGTCEELSFMAGTGEVAMSGDVKVQMKDKLGRVESELTTATLKYKIDANAVGASIKP